MEFTMFALAVFFCGIIAGGLLSDYNNFRF